jgi:cyclopropane-fatty-acyl-phospholipid synthase
MAAKEKAQEILSKAGITVNGPALGDIQVHNERLYDRVFTGGTLALGESYMDEWWDCDDLSVFSNKVMLVDPSSLDGVVKAGILLQSLRSSIMNLQSKTRAFQVGEKHYDIGNDLYERMLDKRMIYSCGYWKHAKDLDEAQEHKLDLICRKIGLKEGDSVLDIGCGWGGFAKFAAQRYGARVVGITISKEQAALARERTQGLNVEIRLQDWRDLSDEKFDHIVSVGMFEHVGPKNYRPFFQKAREVLKDDGLFLLHTIGGNILGTHADPWIDRYIFRNGVLPSGPQIAQALDQSPRDPLFVMEDWHNFGADYDTTLMAWHHNIEHVWDALPQYDKRFQRMWHYYLLMCAGTFRARKTHLWQLVLSKQGVPGGYNSHR